MTPAEAHVWIAVFAANAAKFSSTYPMNFERSQVFGRALAEADKAVKGMRELVPERLKALDEALRQGSDIP